MEIFVLRPNPDGIGNERSKLDPKVDGIQTLDADAQRIVSHAVARLDEELGAQIVAYYLIGSQADGTAVALSDVDMVAVLEPASGAAVATAGMLAHQLGLHHRRLDLIVASLEMLSGAGFRRFAPALQRGSLLLKGTGVAEQIATPTAGEWAEVISEGWLRDARRHRGIDELEHPLMFPDPDDEFRGYVEPTPSWVAEEVGRWTHPLVVLVSKGASAILAVSKGVQIATRSEVAPTYAQMIGAPWAGFVTEIDQDCRAKWGYRIPQDLDDKTRLKGWCDLALEFESHCLSVIETAAPPPS